jgi:hypothetical protein
MHVGSIFAPSAISYVLGQMHPAYRIGSAMAALYRRWGKEQGPTGSQQPRHILTNLIEPRGEEDLLTRCAHEPARADARTRRESG